MGNPSLAGLAQGSGLLEIGLHLIRQHLGIAAKATSHLDVGLTQLVGVLELGSFVQLGHGRFEVLGQFVRFGPIGRQEALIDVAHFPTHFLHGAVDQVGGEDPVALIHQLGKFRQPVAGGEEAFGLALNQGHVDVADGGRLAGLAAITGREPEAEQGGYPQEGQTPQVLGQPRDQRRSH